MGSMESGADFNATTSGPKSTNRREMAWRHCQNLESRHLHARGQDGSGLLSMHHQS